MKKIILSVFIFCAYTFLNAQNEPVADSAAVETSVDDDVNIESDRFIFSVHWDGWLGAPDSLKVGAFSRGIGLHFYYDIPFNKDLATNKAQFSFAPGIGYTVSNYANKAQFSSDSAGITSVTPFDASIDPKRNKLVLNYLEVPLEFRFRSKANDKGNRFKAALGFKGSYLFANHITYVGPESAANLDEEIKYKIYRIKSLNTLQYGPTIRLGYANLNLEAYYGLAPIFEDGFGPSGSPIVIGISFNPF